MGFVLTITGESEQSRELTSAVASNTRSLSSRMNKEDSTKTKKGLKQAASESAVGGSSELSLRTRATSRSQGKSDDLPHSESIAHGSPAVRGSTRGQPAVETRDRPRGPKSPLAATSVQLRSVIHTTSEDRLGGKNSRSSQFSDTVTASPMSTRSHSGTSSSPGKSSRDTRSSRHLPWSKETNIITYGQKRGRSDVATANSVKSSSTSASDANIAGPKKRRPGSPRATAGRSPISDNAVSVTTSEDDEGGQLRTIRTRQMQQDVAVQADSQSSIGSSCGFRHSRLRTVSSSPASTPSKLRKNVVAESCSSGRTVVTASSSAQYDTCVASAESQLQDADDIDDDEFNRLASLAHGSPQYVVANPSSCDETVTSGTPRKLRSSQLDQRFATPAEQPPLDKENSSTVLGRVTVVSESERASCAKRRLSETFNADENERSPKHSRNWSELAGSESRRLENSASNKEGVATTSSSSVGGQKRSRLEVLSSLIGNPATEPVAGPSGVITVQNSSSEKSRASSKNWSEFFCYLC